MHPLNGIGLVVHHQPVLCTTNLHFAPCSLSDPNMSNVNKHSGKKVETYKDRLVKWTFFPFPLWIDRGNSPGGGGGATQLNQLGTCFAFLIHSISTFLCYFFVRVNAWITWPNSPRESFLEPIQEWIKDTSYLWSKIRYCKTYQNYFWQMVHRWKKSSQSLTAPLN